MIDRPPVVVVGLDSLPGIQTARLLARRAIPVIGIAARADHYCCRTNVCEQIHVVDTQDEAVIELLARIGQTLSHRGVIYPCTDQSVFILSSHRRRVAPYFHVALPPHDVVMQLMDKVSFHSFARGHDFLVPRTWVVRSAVEVGRVQAEATFPCILKPARRTPQWGLNGNPKVFRVPTGRDLPALVERGLCSTSALIVQEWVEGPDHNLFSCNVYVDRAGEIVGSFVARKLRQWPPRAGISCLGEECRNDWVLGEAKRLFTSVAYRGLGYVEMKREESTGSYFLLEANIGRPTSRSAIAEAGGVDLLYAMYCDCLGWPMPPSLVQQYRGVKWVHLHYDLRSALHYWRHGELGAREWWQSLRGPKAFALFSPQDPKPFFADVRATIVRGLRKI